MYTISRFCTISLILKLFHLAICHGPDCEIPNVVLRHTSTNQDENSMIRVKKAVTTFRIHRLYDESFITMDNSQLIKDQIVEPAIKYWELALVAKQPLQTPLTIDRQCKGAFSTRTINGSRRVVCETSCVIPQTCVTTAVPEQLLQQCFISAGGNSYTASGPVPTGAANTDLAVMVTHKSDRCGESTLAYASACDLDSSTDRPVLGIINLCPGRIKLGSGISIAFSVLRHEIAHILGFSSNLYAFYRFPNGTARTPRDASGLPTVIKTIGQSRIYQYSTNTIVEKTYTFAYKAGFTEEKKYSVIITPTVQAEMRTYFNCSTIDGAFLEDFGGTTNSLSHFEKKMFLNELMTAVIAADGSLSRFTLALMQDTGWYTVNFLSADKYNQTRNIGCDFLTKSCYDFMTSMISRNQPIAPYCNSVQTLFCSEDASTVQYCPLVLSSFTIPNQYRYMSDPNLIYPDHYSDYCPFVQTYAQYSTSGSLENTGACTDSNNNAVSGTSSDYFNQRFGSSSTCVPFDPSVRWSYQRCNTRTFLRFSGAGCYVHKCSTSYGLVIVVNGLSYQCRTTGQVIDVTSKNQFIVPSGQLICPACNSRCPSQLCQKAAETLATPCNNINRVCPGESISAIPCSASTKTTAALTTTMLCLAAVLIGTMTL